MGVGAPRRKNRASHSDTDVRVQLIRVGFESQGFWLEGSPKTVSKRAFGWKGHQKTFPKVFLVGRVSNNRFQNGFWLEGSSKTVSKMAFGGKVHQKPFPKWLLVEMVIKNCFQKGFWLKGPSKTVSKRVFG